MKITDEAVEAAAIAACEHVYPPKTHRKWDDVDDFEQDSWRATMRVAIAAAYPHLTDDGAGSGEPAVAAGEAGSIPAGNPAPSSPHPDGANRELAIQALHHERHFGRKCENHDPRECLHYREAWRDADVLSAAGVFGEGATPAIDREVTR